MLRTSLPARGDVAALLALLLLTESRRAARADQDGLPVPLEDQDRSAWDGRLIAEGVQLADEAMAAPPLGGYHLQAAIAALHATAPPDKTDWGQILASIHYFCTSTPAPWSLSVARSLLPGCVGPQRAYAHYKNSSKDQNWRAVRAWTSCEQIYLNGSATWRAPGMPCFTPQPSP